MYSLTCKELHTVNIHANIVVSLLTANMPSTQVRPRRGKRIMMVLMADLLNRRMWNVTELLHGDFTSVRLR